MEFPEVLDQGVLVELLDQLDQQEPSELMDPMAHVDYQELVVHQDSKVFQDLSEEQELLDQPETLVQQELPEMMVQEVDKEYAEYQDQEGKQD